MLPPLRSHCPCLLPRVCLISTLFSRPLPLQLVMSEIDASSPMALQAVKALALYMKAQKEAALAQVGTNC